MFQSARLTLTAWYILIAFIITALFSLLAYNGFRFEFERGLQKQQIIFQQNNSRQSPPNILFRRDVDPNLQKELRDRLLARILYIDLVIIIAAAAGGYILAGRTLKPIKKMMDEQHRFITDASHELRTPLTAMRSEMETSLLTKKMTDKDTKELIKSNLEEVINLQNLSDGLLTLAQYQTRNTKREQTQLSLTQIVTDAITKVMPLAKKKQITVDDKTKDYALVGNSDYLLKLFIILLDNAIKYSPKNSTIILASYKTDHNVKIDVKDQGVGIEKSDLEKIFDRFYRSDKSRQRSDIGGYGLGLAIARQIVEEHGGTISVTSKVDKGSTFTVKLPITS